VDAGRNRATPEECGEEHATLNTKPRRRMGRDADGPRLCSEVQVGKVSATETKVRAREREEEGAPKWGPQRESRQTVREGLNDVLGKKPFGF
jgi:hypothetical protein